MQDRLAAAVELANRLHGRPIQAIDIGRRRTADRAGLHPGGGQRTCRNETGATRRLDWTRRQLSVIRCLVPRCGGGRIPAITKETLRDRYFTEAPRPLTPSERQYSDRRRRSRR